MNTNIQKEQYTTTTKQNPVDLVWRKTIHNNCSPIFVLVHYLQLIRLKVNYKHTLHQTLEFYILDPDRVMENSNCLSRCYSVKTIYLFSFQQIFCWNLLFVFIVNPFEFQSGNENSSYRKKKQQLKRIAWVQNKIICDKIVWIERGDMI